MQHFTYLVVADGVPAVERVAETFRAHELNVEQSWFDHATRKHPIGGVVIGLHIGRDEDLSRRTVHQMGTEFAQKMDHVAGAVAPDSNILFVIEREGDERRPPFGLYRRIEAFLSQIVTFIESDRGISVSINAIDLRPASDDAVIAEHVADVILRRGVISRGVVVSSDELERQSLRDALLGQSL